MTKNHKFGQRCSKFSLSQSGKTNLALSKPLHMRLGFPPPTPIKNKNKNLCMGGGRGIWHRGEPSLCGELNLFPANFTIAYLVLLRCALLRFLQTEGKTLHQRRWLLALLRYSYYGGLGLSPQHRRILSVWLCERRLPCLKDLSITREKEGKWGSRKYANKPWRNRSALRRGYGFKGRRTSRLRKGFIEAEFEIMSEEEAKIWGWRVKRVGVRSGNPERPTHNRPPLHALGGRPGSPAGQSPGLPTRSTPASFSQPFLTSEASNFLHGQACLRTEDDVREPLGWRRRCLVNSRAGGSGQAASPW